MQGSRDIFSYLELHQTVPQTPSKIDFNARHNIFYFNASRAKIA